MWLDDEETGISLGWTLAVLTIFLAVTALLAAATNNYLFELLKNFQVLIGSIVAAAIGFIAYVGATATARENRRASRREFLREQLTHIVRLKAEIEGMYSWRATLLEQAVDIKSDWALARCIGFSTFLRKQELPCLEVSFSDIGLFETPLRNAITRAWSEYLFMRNHSAALSNATMMADDKMRKSTAGSSAACVLTFDNALEVLEGALKPFIFEHKIEAHQMEDFIQEKLKASKKKLRLSLGFLD